MIGHPSEARLLGFQDGTLGERSRRRIAAHLADCQGCRNLVQGHRSVRAALLGDPTAAPAGVLERALATRAAGTVIMLPVADPDLGGAEQGSAGGGRQRWSWRRPKLRAPQGLGASLLRIGALAGTAAVMGALVLNLVASTPVFSFGLSDQRWASIKQGIIDFDLPASTVNRDDQITWSFERPLGAPAVLHPERLRPFTAVYSVTQFLANAPNTPPEATSSPGLGYRLTTSSQSGHLILEQLGVSSSWLPVRLELSATTLEPLTWTERRIRSGGDGEGGRYNYDELLTYTIDQTGGRIHRVVKVENLQGKIPGRRLEPSRITELRMLREPAAPVVVGREADLILMFQAVPLADGWRGSFERWQSMVATEPHRLYQHSYEVEGSASITTPVGTFDTWVVKAYYAGGDEGETYFLRKSDGLLLQKTSGWGSAGQPGEPYRRGSTVMELQSITYP